MELKEQVCTLEQAKTLEGLGVMQKSMFSYCIHRQSAFPDPQIWYSGQIYDYEKDCVPAFMFKEKYAAFTVAELGAMLPEWVYSKQNSGGGEEWCCLMVEDHVRMPKKIRLQDFYAATEAAARASMLIHLLKKEIIIKRHEQQTI